MLIFIGFHLCVLCLFVQIKTNSQAQRRDKKKSDQLVWHIVRKQEFHFLPPQLRDL